VTVSLTLGTYTPSFLVELARREGRFAEAGLNVFEAQVTSSPQQFRSLAAGEYDAVFTNPDNVVAYQFVATNPLEQLLGLRVLGGVDRGLGLGLYRRAGVDPQNRRVRLGVDVAASGFALIAFEVMTREGFDLAELQIDNLGATPLRAEALIEGICDYTILNAGNEQRALAHDATLVAPVESIGPYVGTLLATRAELNDELAGAVEALRDVMREVITSVLAGERDDEVLDAVSRRLRLDTASAQRHLDVIKDPHRGLVADLGVDRSAIATVVGLRQRYLPDPAVDQVLDSLESFIDADALR
jgi:hypothetical protein